jgi:type II secretory pathway pseudopilin PulG
MRTLDLRQPAKDFQPDAAVMVVAPGADMAASQTIAGRIPSKRRLSSARLLDPNYRIETTRNASLRQERPDFSAMIDSAFTASQLSLRQRSRRASAGFTYLALLFLIVIMGTALVAIAQVWHTQVQRDKEEQLLFVGDQFRQAIASYYERAPGGIRMFPKTLQDLLQDPRFPNVQRHLRRIYLDPMTGKDEWAFVRGPDGGILGIHSISEEAPIKVAGFKGTYVSFAEATTYKDWIFSYLPFDARGGTPQAGLPGSQTGLPGSNLPGANGGGGNIPGAYNSSQQSANNNGMTGASRSGMSDAEDEQIEKAARELKCRAQRSSDMEMCSQVLARTSGGSNTQCLVSVTKRQQACMSGATIPGLNLQ